MSHSPFGAADVHVGGVYFPLASQHQRLDRAALRCVTQRRGCSVRIDVVDRGGREGRVLQRKSHGAVGARARGRRRCDMVCVRGGTIADEFGVDVGGASKGVRQSLDFGRKGGQLERFSEELWRWLGQDQGRD